MNREPKKRQSKTPASTSNTNTGENKDDQGKGEKNINKKEYSVGNGKIIIAKETLQDFNGDCIVNVAKTDCETDGETLKLKVNDKKTLKDVVDKYKQENKQHCSEGEAYLIADKKDTGLKYNIIHVIPPQNIEEKMQLLQQAFQNLKVIAGKQECKKVAIPVSSINIIREANEQEQTHNPLEYLVALVKLVITNNPNAEIYMIAFSDKEFEALIAYADKVLETTN